MRLGVSTGTVALALAIMMVGLDDVVDARPMHAAIFPKYHRYLEAKEELTAELKEWLNVYGPKGPKTGFIPVTELRSSDEELEDQRQRFYLTKEQIMEAREANPLAVFGTQGPFTLMTMEEFQEFLVNGHVGDSNKTEASRSKTHIDTPSTENSKNNDSDNNDNDDNDIKRKRRVPATEGPTVIDARRRLHDAEKSQNDFDGEDYGADEGKNFENTPDFSFKQTYQSETHQSNTATKEGDTNKGWNFGDVSTGDSAQIAVVSDGGGSSTGTWWGTNGWGGSNWWSNWGNGGSNAVTWNVQSTQAPGSTDSQWAILSSWTSSSEPSTEPPSSRDHNQLSAGHAITYPTPTTVRAPTQAPAANKPAPPAPALAPPVVPATAPNPSTKPATPAPPPKKAPAPAPAPAPVPVSKKTYTAVESSMTAKDSDSDSVDWSTSACVHDPGLQGQCGSCWAFATVAALEAVQCIRNGDKKAPTYSKQQLVSCNTKNFGCNGGASVYAMEYIRDNGICFESSYGYTSLEGGQPAACSRSCSPTKTELKEIGKITAGDESTLLSIVKQQPVIASVISNTPAWKQYISGVITDCPAATVDHAVLVVGYDATTIKIKNSWGTEWGEDGYVRISRSSLNMGTCGVLTDMSYPKL